MILCKELKRSTNGEYRKLLADHHFLVKQGDLVKIHFKENRFHNDILYTVTLNKSELRKIMASN